MSFSLAMLVKSIKSNQVFFLLLFFCALVGWQMIRERGPVDAELVQLPAPVTKERPTSPQAVDDGQREEEVKRKPRVAVVTFITEQKSYVHLSLKNKDRE